MSEKLDNDDDGSLAEGMESALAEAVCKFPILYDKTHKCRFPSMYPEQHEQAWQRISDELNLEVSSCKSLWSCMKQKFIKHRKRLDKGEPVSAWPTYDELVRWLDRHVKKRRTRYDFMKQMKSNRRTKPSESVNEFNDDDDDGEGAEEEWTDLMEDKDTMVKIQFKRNDRTTDASASAKKKFKFEVVNEEGSVTEIAELDASHKEDSSQGGDKISSAAIEVIEVKESQIDCKNSCAFQHLNTSLDTNLIKLEQIVLKCVHMAERSMTENAYTDSNDSFGKYIAALVRELPVDKRVRAQFNILQYATEMIHKETKI